MTNDCWTHNCWPSFIHDKNGLCSICNNRLIQKTREIRKEDECSACRLGVIARNCTCERYTVNEDFMVCNFCEKCFRCKKEDSIKVHENKPYCESCYIKISDPSTRNIKYVYKYIEWKIDYKLENCVQCKRLFHSKLGRNNEWYVRCYNCYRENNIKKNIHLLPNNIDELTVIQLKECIKSMGLYYKSTDRKKNLQEILKECLPYR